MSDERLRRLERAANSGDKEAAALLAAHWLRVSGGNRWPETWANPADPGVQRFDLLEGVLADALGSAPGQGWVGEALFLLQSIRVDRCRRGLCAHRTEAVCYQINGSVCPTQHTSAPGRVAPCFRQEGHQGHCMGYDDLGKPHVWGHAQAVELAGGDTAPCSRCTRPAPLDGGCLCEPCTEIQSFEGTAVSARCRVCRSNVVWDDGDDEGPPARCPLCGATQWLERCASTGSGPVASSLVCEDPRFHHGMCVSYTRRIAWHDCGGPASAMVPFENLSDRNADPCRYCAADLSVRIARLANRFGLGSR